MTNNLIIENNADLTFYGILIGTGVLITSGIILGITLYCLQRRNNTNYPITNMEPIINEEIEVIKRENTTTNENVNINDMNNSDLDNSSDSSSDEGTIDSQSTIDVDTEELDLFFMPNVDLDVYSIYELKHFEISSLYSQEMLDHGISEEELYNIIGIFTEADLLTNDINESILLVITYINS